MGENYAGIIAIYVGTFITFMRMIGRIWQCRSTNHSINICRSDESTIMKYQTKYWWLIISLEFYSVYRYRVIIMWPLYNYIDVICGCVPWRNNVGINR